MRELILKMSMSVDGFVSDLDGRNTWMFGGDQEAKAWSVETLWNASLHIMGSRTFQAMANHWPTSDDMFAPPMNRIPKAVFSQRGSAILTDLRPPALLDEGGMDAEAGKREEQQPGAESWTEAYVARGELTDEIAKLKAKAGKPIIAHGGARFARSLAASALVDQFVLLVHPVVLGVGSSLFSEVSAPTALKLMGSRAFSGGAVAQVYRTA